MLRDEVIQPSTSPWASPVVLVAKKDGTLRFCVDYRRLNKITKKDVYPLPRIDDSFDRLLHARYFSSLDLRSGYWEIEVDERDREKTAFITPDAGGARNSSCLEEPILENCTTVRLLWRFMPSRNKCEAGFVCTDHKNAFETEEKCNATCPPVPPDEPKPKKHNCKYWLSHQYLCHKTSMKMHYDKKNRLHRVLWMTHCKEEERKVYSYDSVDHKCKGEELKSCMNEFLTPHM
ncbi:hypothetical protein V5799_021122 [Amblyomma americanum]|uniref:Reverse transcriptase domain-containing protein n=1 Tax=Amblyomma americanum TaxID=6943 RepID=A0AAQ4FT91_AMBAM